MKRSGFARPSPVDADGKRRYSTFTGKRKPIVRKPMKRRPARRIDERKFMRPFVAFVHSLPCCCELGVYRFGLPDRTVASGYRESMCGGRIEANHAGEKPGIALKSPDSTCIPMCSKHHRDWTEHRGLFALWTREERRAWADAQIARTQLAATPESADQARMFAGLGLGEWLEAESRWVPSWGQSA